MNNNQNQSQNESQPQSEEQRIIDRKAFVIGTLQKKFNEDAFRDRLLKISGGDESKIIKSLNSFFSYILKDEGGKDDYSKNDNSPKKKKKYIADCSVSSIASAFLESFQMGIEVGGGRDHAYLVNYAGQCELEISYKGFVFALTKHFDNPFVITENVFEGDDFKCNITDSEATYSHTPKDPFNKTWIKLRGCYCYFSYTQRDNKQKVSRIIMIQKSGEDGLEMIRSKAKGSFAWKDFPFEQTKKSTLRRAIKIPFAQIDFGEDELNLETQDNKHSQFESNSNSSERLKLLMDKHREMMDDDKPKPVNKIAQGKPADNDPNRDAEKESDGNREQKQEVLAPESNAPKAEMANSPITNVDEEDFGTFANIDDADFSDSEETNGNIENKAPTESNGTQAGQITQSASNHSQLPPNEESPADAWDGKTIMIQGKAQQRDFASTQAALIYLRKVISQRNHKASRKKIIEENSKLIGALIKDGNGNSVAELHKLADQGA